MSKSFSFKHQRYCFLRMFRNDIDQKFHNFYRACYNLWRLFIFSNLNRGNRSLHVVPSAKVRHLTLDLLKSFFLWTIWNKIIKNESLNLRLQTESWTYRESPLKPEKHSYIWSKINYNSINTGTSENVLWSNSSIQMWSISKDWQTSYAIKSGPTEKFL